MGIHCFMVFQIVLQDKEEPHEKFKKINIDAIAIYNYDESVSHPGACSFCKKMLYNQQQQYTGVQ